MTKKCICVLTSVLILFLFLHFSAFQLSAQQISTVAVVDVSQINSAFPRRSAGYTEIERLKKQYQQEIDEEVDKLELLKRRKLLAQRNQEYKEVGQFETQINQLVEYINSLSVERQKELERRSRSPIAKDFLSDLQEAIAFTAEEKGFTLVLRSNDEGLQWWAPIVDITSDVIKRIREADLN